MNDLNEVIAEVLDISPGDVLDDLGPGRTAEWSSMKHIQLVVALEEAYGISLSHQEIRGILSVRDVRELLQARGVPA